MLLNRRCVLHKKETAACINWYPPRGPSRVDELGRDCINWLVLVMTLNSNKRMKSTGVSNFLMTVERGLCCPWNHKSFKRGAASYLYGQQSVLEIIHQPLVVILSSSEGPGSGNEENKQRLHCDMINGTAESLFPQVSPFDVFLCRAVLGYAAWWTALNCSYSSKKVKRIQRE